MPFVIVTTHFHQIIPMVRTFANRAAASFGNDSDLAAPGTNTFQHCSFETTRDSGGALVFLYRLCAANAAAAGASSEALSAAFRAGVDQDTVERAAVVLAAISDATGRPGKIARITLN